ncbi:MAG: hypothetical protein HY897_21925 [Deltaproteobacteria bacterium]|nr:hypothetical protein [Deltaproteobacteria bacterium]
MLHDWAHDLGVLLVYAILVSTGVLVLFLTRRDVRRNERFWWVYGTIYVLVICFAPAQNRVGPWRGWADEARIHCLVGEVAKVFQERASCLEPAGCPPGKTLFGENGLDLRTHVCVKGELKLNPDQLLPADEWTQHFSSLRSSDKLFPAPIQELCRGEFILLADGTPEHPKYFLATKHMAAELKIRDDYPGPYAKGKR